jgi:hypothetical protein
MARTVIANSRKKYAKTKATIEKQMEKLFAELQSANTKSYMIHSKQAQLQRRCTALNCLGLQENISMPV